MSGAMRLVTAQSPAPPWWPWPVTGSGWWLKYQKMRSGGWGEATVQLIVCEEPTLRYTDFSPTIEHLGSAMEKMPKLSQYSRLSNISLALTHLGPRGALCDLYGAPCWPGTRKVQSLTRGCSEDTRTMRSINRWIVMRQDYIYWPGWWGSIYWWRAAPSQPPAYLWWTQTDPQPADSAPWSCCLASSRTPGCDNVII